MSKAEQVYTNKETIYNDLECGYFEAVKHL